MVAELSFPVVGIGASAGGLEAISDLLKNLSVETGMAFVIVTHLSKKYESALPEILGRQTKMTVKFAEADEMLKPDRVYVVPPHAVATLARGRFTLIERTEDVQRKPIDVFLSSLASDRGERSIGIILSGSGTDGTLGIKAIKEHGGFTFAQGSDGTAPQHSSMPDSAIASHVTDVVLPTEELAKYIERYARVLDEISGDAEADAEESIEAYRPLYTILNKHVGHDFSGYKEKTFIRRVVRRMQILQIAHVGDYIDCLNSNPDEVNKLFRDLLISVTSFFRDEEAFAVLATTVIPRLFEQAQNNEVRIWVPGCATGEEVYSLAMLVREYHDTAKVQRRVQIFATDIDDNALQVARAGRYPAASLESVSAQRLRRFFTGDDVSFVINKEVRDLCMFSSHSVIRDPPFSRIDLVSCRNLLIYLGIKFQNLVVPVFHFALRPNGYLFLGTSENVTQHTSLFVAVDKKQRIFQRREAIRTPVSLLLPGGTPRIAHSTGVTLRDGSEITRNLRRSIETRILEQYSPPHVVVNSDGDILYYSTRTGKYLEPAAGLPNRQLVSMARRGLRLDLQSALREVNEQRRRIVRENVKVEVDDRMQCINLSIEPFGSEDGEPMFIVVFDDVGEPFDNDSEVIAERDIDLNERLELELRNTRERLQITIEEYETAVEELKSSNEELQSINEELQSANEELETSKEELQSLNEELSTVNTELNSKIDELDRTHNDLRSLFDSTQIATVFLDENLVIRSFTPAVNQIFNLISSDRGRPLTDIVSRIDNADLRKEIDNVFKSGEPLEKYVSTVDSQIHYLMRILPYYRIKTEIEGVLVTFIDVTNIKEAEKRQRVLIDELNHRVRNMLTVICAIARQSAVKSESKQELADALIGRIQAMSTTYTLVSTEQWSDVDFHALISGQLAPHESPGQQRIFIEGEPVLCKPGVAVALGLVFHELATNAAKYGSLSVPQGTVAVTWHIDSSAMDVLTLEWREEGGPAATTPTHQGFGRNLIERELQYALHGKLQFAFEPTGLRLSIQIPLHPHRIFRAEVAGA